MYNPFQAIIKRLERKSKSLPTKVGKVAIKHWLKNFKEEGFEGQHWVEVQRRIKGTSWYQHPKYSSSRKSKILRGQNNSIAKAVANSLSTANWSRIDFVVNLPYAKIHNEGGSYFDMYLGHSVKIPQRKFLGESKQLDKEITDLITQELINVFNQPTKKVDIPW
jgi:phage gpG-like protein